MIWREQYSEITELHGKLCEKKIRDVIAISMPAGNINYLGILEIWLQKMLT